MESEESLSCNSTVTKGHQLTTFFSYLAARLMAGFAINLAFTLVDASLIQMVEDYDGKPLEPSHLFHVNLLIDH